MTTVNILGLSLAGQTGTGFFTGSIAPTFNVLTCNNINISGNTISSIDSNGNINLIPNGSGVTQGKIFIGHNASSGGNQRIQISDITNGAGVAATTYSASGFNVGSVSYLNRSRSIVPGTNLAVASGDLLGQITFSGDDGAAFMAGANIFSQVSGAVSSGIVPSMLALQTADTSGTLTTAISISNAQIVTFTNPIPQGSGGTGVSNTGTWTNAGNVAFSGAHTFTGMLTGDTSVTFPTSGTLATTSSASGIINSGTTSELAYYASSGTTLSGLATANNGTLVTDGSGVPSISSTLPTAVQNNITLLGIINTDLGFTSAATRYIYINDNAFTGELEIQAGDGSAAHGADLRLYGPSHASKAGWAEIGLSAIGGAKFAINGAGLGTGTQLLNVDNSGNISALGFFKGTTIVTSPAVSQDSSLATGTAYQNVLGYDVVLTVYLAVTSATAGTIQIGIGPTNTPTQQTVVSGLTLGALAIIPLTIYLPNNYYALVTLTTVTATISGQQVMPV